MGQQPPPQVGGYAQGYYTQNTAMPGYSNMPNVAQPYPTYQPSPNLNLNYMSAQKMGPVPQINKEFTFEEYISRAFKKCITVAERMEMGKLLQTISKANKNK